MSVESSSVAEIDPFELPRLCNYFSAHSPQPMVAVEGSTHVIRYLNPAFARLTGKSSDKLIGLPFAEAVPEDDANGCLPLLDHVFKTGLPRNLAEQLHRQAAPAYWSYVMWAIRGADEDPVGVMIQVTEATETVAFRRQSMAMNEALLVSSIRQHELIETIKQSEQERHELQHQLFQAKKLESLGVLAGGIAHDLNNMLTPVIGFAELACNSFPKDSAAVPMLEEVGKNARRAADLVQQILAFAGKGRFLIQSVDLSSLVREMMGLLNSSVSDNTKLEYELTPAPTPVDADATQLRQVVMNLVKNASEAIADKAGTVTIRTGILPAEHRALHFPNPKSDLPHGPAVFLEVADTGCGMTPDLIEKIFDPFFTTKFTGRGLGLAAVQGIARGHHGTLEVRSEPGAGSSFRLILPRSTNTTPVRVADGSSEDWRGTGTVLVIDDEKEVRNITARILERAGLTVLVAGDGLEGLSVFREQQKRIGVVVLDMTMPRMGGLESAKALRSLRPDLPIVLMSGFSVEEATFQSAGLGINGFVQKPFKVPGLLAAIRQALEQRGNQFWRSEAAPCHECTSAKEETGGAGD